MEKEIVSIERREDIVDMLAEASARLAKSRKRVAAKNHKKMTDIRVIRCHPLDIISKKYINYSVECDEDNV